LQSQETFNANIIANFLRFLNLCKHSSSVNESIVNRKPDLQGSLQVPFGPARRLAPNKGERLPENPRLPTEMHFHWALFMLLSMSYWMSRTRICKKKSHPRPDASAGADCINDPI
jgi:hypothetical protein